jgi:glycosidase
LFIIAHRTILILLILSLFVMTLPPFQKLQIQDTYAATPENQTLMQFFEWYVPADGNHWNRLASEADALREVGINGIWLPPAYKAVTGSDVGYGVYDWYDLGEFDQKGTVRTKYGTKWELKSAIAKLKTNQMKVYADVVMNHKAGADGNETANAIEVDRKNRTIERSGAYPITSYTRFWFPGRGSTYSSFQWNHTHFNGVDYDDNQKAHKLFKFQGKSWDVEVDQELGNYDYLMFADLDFDNQDVVNEMTNWGTWFVNELDLDGFRLDAVKHIKFDFMKNWLTQVRKSTGKPLFSFGEYWSGKTPLLLNYLTKVNDTMSIFDVDLHHRFQNASNGNGNYDLRDLLADTITDLKPKNSITFVDNHDTQPGQALQSWVAEWFKPQSYAVILTRQEGVPCVFYGDYYGIRNNNIAPLRDKLNPIIKARKDFAYGVQHDYFDDGDVVGWTREGVADRGRSGLATVISDGVEGSKKMFVGKQNAGEVWHDMTNNHAQQVRIGADGWATFPVKSRSLSIYVQKESFVVDNTPPSTPQNATAIEKTDSSITLTWSPSTDNEKVVGYEIYRNQVKVGTVNTTTYTDTGLSPSTNYEYKIVAMDEAGNSSSGVATVSGKTVAESGNSVTIYYKKGLNTPHIHYLQANGQWTNAPGIAMKAAPEYPGYYKFRVNMGNLTTLEACFNDGSSNWDSNNRQNYRFQAGVSSFTPGQKGSPGTIKVGVPSTENINQPPISPPTPPLNPPATQPNEQTSAGSVGKKAVIYYKAGFSNPRIHYRTTSGNWTDVPGVAMKPAETAGYYKIEIDLANNQMVEACFNNGANIWDSNQMKNYLFKAGTSTYVPSSSGDAGKVMDGGPNTPKKDVVKVIGKTMYVNGKVVNHVVEPRVMNGRMLIPFKSFADSFGYTANWSANTKTIRAMKGNVTIVMQVNKKIAQVNGRDVTLDVAPSIVNGRVFVPLRFVTDATGAEIQYQK